MIIRKLDYDDDWSYGHSESDYLKEREAVGLNILTKLREWTNNCFFNPLAGIDYPTRLSNFNQKTLLDDDIQTIILNSAGVVSISEFDSNLDKNNRIYSFNAQIISIYSDEAIALSFSTEGMMQ